MPTRTPAARSSTRPYREKLSLKPFGPVENGRQVLYGLDYKTAAWREGEENPFHTEVGLLAVGRRRSRGAEGIRGAPRHHRPGRGHRRAADATDVHAPGRGRAPLLLDR